MANATRKRRNLQPATGTSRWATQPGIGRNAHPGVLVITAKLSKGKTVSESYTITENRPEGDLLGYRLTKQDGTVYDLTADLTTCDCPDFTVNRAHTTTPE